VDPEVPATLVLRLGQLDLQHQLRLSVPLDLLDLLDLWHLGDLFVQLGLPDLLRPADLDHLVAQGNPEGLLGLVAQDCLVDPEGLVTQCRCRVDRSRR
jgi:hypothetical protein